MDAPVCQLGPAGDLDPGRLTVRDSLFSPLWYRIAEQMPRLGADVVVRQQHSREQPWYVLIGGATGRQCRINRSAYRFVGCCDGQHSVQAIWDALLHDLRDDAPTQDEVIQVLARLAEQGFIEYGAPPDIQAQTERLERRVARRHRANVNPLAFRLPLGDPAGLLRRLQGLSVLLFHPLAIWLWLGAMVLAAAVAVSNWDLLANHASSYMATPQYLFLAWVAFPFIKALHELGHGLAVRHWGGEVHEAGISLFVLTPAPYVDASASAGFRRRSQRAGVAAIGIMVELAVAAIAMLLWFSIQPGLLRDLAFVTMFIASVSTLLFNANPLLTFDGYYVLCDALDLPNLGTRSRGYWINLLRRAVYGASRVAAMESAPGERKWLLAYAPLSITYRILLSGMVVLWVGHYSLPLGLIIAAYVAFAVLLMPLVRTVRGVLELVPGASSAWRARSTLAAAALACILVLFVVPLPFQTAAWGMVWLPDHARTRPKTDGFVVDFAARDGEQVIPGQLLLTLQDPTLLAQRAELASELGQLTAQRVNALHDDALRSSNLQQEIQRVQGDLERVQDLMAQLEVRSQAAGQLVMPKQQDLLGSFVKRGTTLGYVLDRGEVGVRAVVPERDAALIRESYRGVEVRLAESIGQPMPAALVRDVPAAGFELPGAALGDRGGGPFMTDPADREGLTSIEPVVLIDLLLPERALERVGGRVWVRFDHGAQPLAVQAYRRLRQLFLQHFSATG